MDESIQEAFKAWFSGFRPGYDVERAFVLSIGRASDVQSQQLATLRETLDSHDKWQPRDSLEFYKALAQVES